MDDLTVSTTPPTPSVVTPTTIQTLSSQVKSATPDIILFDDSNVATETMADLIFEDIGGQELLSIARSDTINGQPISYQPIKNLSNIQQSFNPNNIISLQQTSDKYFDGFSIKLNQRIPTVGNGPNGENVYIDATNGNLVIEVVNMQSDEQVEVQIVTGGTIYEVNI